MKKIGLIIIGMILLLPLSVKAECSNSEKVRLQKIAGNVNFKIDYTENYPKVDFHITITNMHPDIRIFDTYTGNIYTYGMDPNNQSEITIYNYKDDKTIQYIFYSQYANCKDEIVFKNYVTLPSYNHYYMDKLCQGLNGYKLCQKWEKNTMNYAEFLTSINKYRENHNITNNATDNDNEKYKYDEIINFVSKYYLFILIPIIIICSGLIVYLDKKDGF